MDVVPVSFGLAFLAGLVSFLSPCILPIVPSYISFVTGLTLEDLAGDDRSIVRRQAALHAALFILGFSLVFVALGASATVAGDALRRSLPLLQQIGGVVIALFGLYMLGVLRLPFLMRERRVHLARRPTGRLGSVIVGVAFGAGWTPCVGPVLATILLYAGLEASAGQGMLLLSAYAIGLGLPFFFAALAFNWFVASMPLFRRWMKPMERAAGALMVVMGVLLFTGKFAALASFFAGFGQLINLEI